MSDFTLVDLGFDQSITKDFEIPPVERHAGDQEDLGRIVTEHISIKIGNKPLVYNIKELYKISNQTLPVEMQLFVSYDLWLVNFSLAVLKSGGVDSIKQIGFRVQYQHPITTTVLDVLPKTEYINWAEGKASFEADLSINGQIAAPNLNMVFTDKLFQPSVGGKVHVLSDSSLAARISFSCVTTSISSVGVGSNYSEWILNKKENPLHGDDITLSQIILVPKGTSVIQVRTQVYACISIYNLIPSRRSSSWIDIKCPLLN